MTGIEFQSIWNEIPVRISNRSWQEAASNPDKARFYLRALRENNITIEELEASMGLIYEQYSERQST